MGTSRIFCLPHAGGAASTFLSWKRFLGKDIELFPLELPGRGMRYGEPYHLTIEDAVSDIYNQVHCYLDDLPYAIFGHSMGTILAYELAVRIDREKMKMPFHMFFSGRHAPYEPDTLPDLCQLTDDKFIEIFAALGGVSREILENYDVMSYMLPILRADTRLVNAYNCNIPIHEFDCNITVMYGIKDSLTLPQTLQSWKKCCKRICAFKSYDEGHFFINSCRSEVVDDIALTINNHYL